VCFKMFHTGVRVCNNNNATKCIQIEHLNQIFESKDKTNFESFQKHRWVKGGKILVPGKSCRSMGKVRHRSVIVGKHGTRNVLSKSDNI
jgi:hypothetical protein